jgi:hypothetical protein
MASIGSASEPAAIRAAEDDERSQSTQLISRALDGGTPNGPSTNPVISNDRRFARYVAFESEASDLVRGDGNGVKDVFAVRRAGSFRNNGSAWRRGATVLLSRARRGSANGPSFAPAVSGGFNHAPSCVAFLSKASNLVKGDTNRKVDAFVVRRLGARPVRVSLPGRRQARKDTTHVAVSGNCSRIAFVTGGRLYVAAGRRVKALKAPGRAGDPAFASGMNDDLVFAAKRGVYLSRKATGKPKLVGPGGRNPVFNDIDKAPPACKRPTLAYERMQGGHWQVVSHVLGRGARVVSRRNGSLGNGDSRNPVIGNAGCYVTFESDASNLGVNASNRTGDSNRKPDVYLFTAVRDITLVQSVKTKAVPAAGGGRNPSMSFYANYIVFDSPAPMEDQGLLDCIDPDDVLPDDEVDPPVDVPPGTGDVDLGLPIPYVDPNLPPILARGGKSPVLCDEGAAADDGRSRQVFMRYLGPV